MSYRRVLPRDLFNEAALLRMLGVITLNILDKPGQVPLSYENLGGPFVIEQDPNDGSIRCTSLKFFYGQDPVEFFRPLNARATWALYAVYKNQELPVFDDDGELLFPWSQK